MNIAFKAQIYDFRTRTCKTSDKTTRITLEQDNLNTQILDAIHALQNSSKNEYRELNVNISDERVECKISPELIDS